jgi:hypothetical protein
MTEEQRNSILAGLKSMIAANDEDFTIIDKLQTEINERLKAVEMRSKVMRDGIDEIKGADAAKFN